MRESFMGSFLFYIFLRIFYKVYYEKTYFERRLKSMAKTRMEWNELYNKFEGMYNPYPVQMSRAEAFGKARNDGLITDEEYAEAQEFYGRLWNYNGD